MTIYSSSFSYESIMEIGGRLLPRSKHNLSILEYKRIRQSEEGETTAIDYRGQAKLVVHNCLFGHIFPLMKNKWFFFVV